MTSRGKLSAGHGGTAVAGHTAAAAHLIRSGETAESSGDHVAAEVAYLRLADDPEPDVAAEGHFRLGVLLWKQSRLDAALPEYQRARALALQAERMDIVARAENAIGAVFYARGEYEQARASYLAALALTKDPVTRGRALLNLGVLANIQGDLDRALEHYLRARAIFRDSGDEKSEALALRNLLMLNSDRREWEDADYTSREALVLLERLGDRGGVAEVLRDRSEVLAARGETLEAIRHCELATRIFIELGNQLGRAESELLRGRYLRGSGLVAEAERSLTDACRTAKHFRNKLLEAEASRELAALYRGTRNTKDAGRWRARAMKLFTELGAQREVAALERGDD